MKKTILFLIILCAAFSFFVIGCGSGKKTSQVSSGSVAGENNGGTHSDSSSRSNDQSGDLLNDGNDSPEAGDDDPYDDDSEYEMKISPETESKKRITYKGNQSSVTYVSSVKQLPDEEEFSAFDDSYFEEHALLLVRESVNSGSIDVGILSVTINGSEGIVTLYHDVPDNVNITTDMATWLIWTEVEPGLQCRWTVENPALEPDSVRY